VRRRRAPSAANSSRTPKGCPPAREARGRTDNEANASYGDRIIRLRDGWLVDE